jgi:UDP-N-acetylmuramate--alanine ligase
LYKRNLGEAVMKYHFIGIGGIGMSGLAQILLERGASVQGSDISINFLTKKLQSSGVLIFSTHDASNIPPLSTVVYNTQIKETHPEYVAASELNLPMQHRSDLLSHLMEGYLPILVTGTHGKTTVSSLLAHVLDVANQEPSFVIGGIALNFDTNASHRNGLYFVAEADESDGSFIKYRSHAAIITNIEKEHIDLWGSEEALIEGVKKFACNVSHFLWLNGDDPILAALALSGKKFGFGLGNNVQIITWCQMGWNLVVDFLYEGQPYLNFEIPLIGIHNVLNAAAVFGVAMELKIDEAFIRAAFKSFKGVKRRMEKKGENRGVCFYDDYAHHPTEIATTLQGLRKAIGEKRLIAVFQPHRYTRLQSFWEAFLGCFKQADVLFITDVYSVLETPIPGFDSLQFYNDFKAKNRDEVYYIAKKNIVSDLPKFLRPHDVVVTLGAGDITNICAELPEQNIPIYKIGVCQGGKSVEHEISLLSAKTILGVINRDYYQNILFTITRNGEWLENGQKKSMSEIVQALLHCDVIFPVLHGPFGEDGILQGFFETLGVCYAGSDSRSCAVAMDKVWTKQIARENQISVARFITFSIDQWEKDPSQVYSKIRQEFSFPFYVKASHLGSSIGIHRVVDDQSLIEAIKEIATLDYSFLVEEEILGREIEFGVLGNFEVVVSEPFETAKGFNTYERKYSGEGGELNFHPQLSAKERATGKLLAKTAYEAVNCKGLSRVDFFLKKDGTWLLNEINPMPGFTAMSHFPGMWQSLGFSFEEVVDRIIISALHRKRYYDSHLCPQL